VTDRPIEAGLELDQFVVDAVSSDRMRIMRALLDDPTPIHFDIRAVRALGMGDREINQGPMCLGYLTELVTRWTGDPLRLRRLRCRLLGNVFAGERLACSGRVTAVDRAAATCELDLVVVAGPRKVAQGDATVAIPSGRL
jgi:acyl dehydratase